MTTLPDLALKYLIRSAAKAQASDWRHGKVRTAKGPRGFTHTLCLGAPLHCARPRTRWEHPVSALHIGRRHRDKTPASLPSCPSGRAGTRWPDWQYSCCWEWHSSALFWANLSISAAPEGEAAPSATFMAQPAAAGPAQTPATAPAPMTATMAAPAPAPGGSMLPVVGPWGSGHINTGDLLESGASS